MALRPDGSGNLSATLVASRSFPVAVAEFVSHHRAFMQKDGSFLDWFSWLGSFLAGLVLVYFLAAPPVIIAAWKQGGVSNIPTIYQPVMRIIESDFGGPLLWYFNSVWHAGIMLIGEKTGPRWYLVLLYAVLGIGLVAVSFFPFVRRIRWRTK